MANIFFYGDSFNMFSSYTQCKIRSINYIFHKLLKEKTIILCRLIIRKLLWRNLNELNTYAPNHGGMLQAYNFNTDTFIIDASKYVNESNIQNNWKMLLDDVRF